MSSWLSKQKKPELQSLASHAGLSHETSQKKDELIASLDTHLKANASKYADDKLFAEYFERAGSPAKPKDASSAAAGKEVTAAPKRRKTTTVKAEPASPATAGSRILASPAIRRISAAIPSSPAISSRYNTLSRGLNKQYSSLVKRAGVKKNREAVRAYLSHVDTVYVAITLLESIGLLKATFPASLVASEKLKDYGSFSYPTLNWGVLLSSIFWAPTTLWLLTSVILPTTAAYFFNLTYQQPRTRTRKPLRELDPLTFAITKALTTWFVYAPGSSFRFFGLYSTGTVRIVQDYLYGGYFGLYVGSAIGALLSIYDLLSYKS